MNIFENVFQVCRGIESYDMTGKEVASLVNHRQDAGKY